MVLKLGPLRDALLSAGADDQKAQKAAEEVAVTIRPFGELRSDVKVLKWMQGATFAGVVATLFKLFLH